MRLILCIIAAEAITQLISKAELFDSIREWIKKLSNFTNELFSCAYCLSVWVATFTTFLYVYWDISWIFITMLVIHRLSNVLHDIFKIIFNFKSDQILKRK